MLRIFSSQIKASQYYGSPSNMNYRPPHLDPRLEQEYPESDTVTIHVDAEDSETGRPYIAYVTRHINPHDGRVDSAELEDIEPETKGDRDAVPDVPGKEWVKSHWDDIRES